MRRNFDDWLLAYCSYASHKEAPRRMNFWAGVSAVAGALRRRIWIDQFYFQWIPNFYIIFVAPPGVATKSTTADNAMDLLRSVPDIHFGPDIVTWQALVTSFAASATQYPVNGHFQAESAITCVASELGNLLDPEDRQLVDLLVTLWDNKKGLEKTTKMSGEDHVTNPTANIIGCTTPSWLQENVPHGVVGGGFTSRCVFVYADKKERLVALPRDHIPKGLDGVKSQLVEDLVKISEIVGEYELRPEAKKLIVLKYDKLWSGYDGSEEIFGNYIARKQSHMMKLSMVIAAAQRDEPVITEEDIAAADLMLTDTEVDMPRVFARMGRSEASIQSDRLVSYIRRRGVVPYEEAYRYVHSNFPDFKDYEGILAGAIRSGLITVEQRGSAMVLIAPIIAQ